MKLKIFAVFVLLASAIFAGAGVHLTSLPELVKQDQTIGTTASGTITNANYQSLSSLPTPGSYVAIQLYPGMQQLTIGVSTSSSWSGSLGFSLAVGGVSQTSVSPVLQNLATNATIGIGSGATGTWTTQISGGGILYVYAASGFSGSLSLNLAAAPNSGLSLASGDGRYARKFLAPRVRIASSFGGTLQSGSPSQSNGTGDYSETNRFQFQLNANYVDLQLLYRNALFSSSTIDSPNGNAVSFNAVIEEGGNLIPVDFPSYGSTTAISSGGHTPVIIGDGQNLWSLKIPGYFPGSTNMYLRNYVSVSSGQKYPFQLQCSVAGNSGILMADTTSPTYGISPNNTGADATQSYATPGGGHTSGALAFGPSAIIGTQVGAPTEVAMIAGDSIDWGAGQPANNWVGWVGTQLTTDGIAFHNDAISGSTLQSNALYAAQPAMLTPYVDDFYVNLGTNDIAGGSPDITTLAQYQSYLLTLCQRWCANGAHAHLITILPRSTSTDHWATYQNQSTQSFDPLRVQINNWLRDTTSTGALASLALALNTQGTVDDVSDPCALIEYSYNTSTSTASLIVLTTVNGKPNQQAASSYGTGNGTATGGCYYSNGTAYYGTYDGIHPTSNIYTMMGPALVTKNLGPH